MAPQDDIIAAFATQYDACNILGSPLTADLVAYFRDDYAAGGDIAGLLRDWPDDALNNNVPLRLAGFVHFMALNEVEELGEAEDKSPQKISRFFASCGGQYEAADRPALNAALADLFATAKSHAKQFLRRTPQTNEVGRAGILLIGFSEIARRTGLPLRLLEIGASAGLNMNFDRFYYQLDTPNGMLHWGSPDSALTIQSQWRGGAPKLLDKIEVASRRGCDLSPIDLSDEVAHRALRSWIWGDMDVRRARLMAALEIAAQHPPVLDKADAASWSAAQIAERPSGQTTLLYHSIVWPYLGAAQQASIEARFAQAGKSVTPDAPLAWLRLDHSQLQSFAYLSYRLWTGDNGPDGEEIIIGQCHPHGADIDIEVAF